MDFVAVAAGEVKDFWRAVGAEAPLRPGGGVSASAHSAVFAIRRSRQSPSTGFALPYSYLQHRTLFQLRQITKYDSQMVFHSFNVLTANSKSYPSQQCIVYSSEQARMNLQDAPF